MSWAGLDGLAGQIRTASHQLVITVVDDALRFETKKISTSD